ncbi:uncharacterized protein LOC143369285 [Andrena cerasifolii]|uniref:uncharacterized protein LOC143369285 n=1 Tax=Andrena cerasifolii TaxID=2819439 RepID=UPI00403808F4
MKEQWSISKDKLVALEDGTSRNEEHECAKPAGRSNACKQAIQSIKLILYLVLLMIVGWTCYSIWKPYHAQSIEVKVTDIIQEPKSQNLLLLKEQPTHETSTIAARPFYGSEDTLKRQDEGETQYDLQKFVPADRDEIFNSENTESSLGWPAYIDYPTLPEAMNFPFFFPSFSSMEVDEREKEPESSERAERLFDNISEDSQQLEEQEKNLLDNYMLLSLLVQNAASISQGLKDSKEVVDPKFEFELENSGPLKIVDTGSFEWEHLNRFASKDLSSLEWDDSGRLESQEEIGSDLEDSEGKASSTRTDDNYESATLNILNNTHKIVPEDSTEPEQEETLIKSNEQMHESMVAWGEEGKYEEEQSLLEKSAIRNAETFEDYSEDVDQSYELTSAILEIANSGPLEIVSPLEWDDSGRLESQKEIGSDLEDSEEKASSTRTDDNYESATLNILNNTHEIVPEEQEETLIKSNEQMHQSMDPGVVDGFDRSASEERKHDEEQATGTIASGETEAEIEDDGTPQFPFNFRDSVENTHSLGLHSDTGGSSLENQSDEASESDSYDWETYNSLLIQAQSACFGTSFPWVLIDHEDNNNSYDRGAQDRCNEHTKAFCEYWNRTLKLAGCSKYSLVMLTPVPI